MRKNSGIARLVCVFAICIALIGYNAYSFCFKGRTVKNVIMQNPVQEETSSEEEKPEKENAQSEDTLSLQEEAESAPASPTAA